MPKPDLRQGSPLFIDAFAGFASILRVWLQSDQPVVVLQTLSHRQSRRRHILRWLWQQASGVLRGRLAGDVRGTADQVGLGP
jgi:hypothetical protein